MKSSKDIISQAILSEKSTIIKEKENKYVFKVNPLANKHEIKHAIETAFGVKVTDIKTVNVKGKTKRLGRFEGKRSSWKKAIIKLKEGNSIEIFENV
ncbi:MAG: 50S ribosomal protein L23 [candidate division Zixibacteria bacterium]|nr:50S ribosomal protein L23 [candidate division Zixibacteria bacterium]